MEKIKACPFCGREATMVDCKIHPRWYIECTYTYCGVEQPRCYATKEAAIKAWNRRTKEVKHAHWIPKQYPFGNCECSNCQEEYGICGGLLGDYNYCPNCGAIMDETENKE